jgi:hypothetical protein
MHISQQTFNMLFLCAILYLVARKVYDKYREECGIAKPASNIDLSGMFWPYIKAVIAGAAFVFVMWEFLPGSPMEEMAEDGLPSWVVRLAVMMSIIPLVMITTPFIFIAGLCVRALKLRRGVADILTGTIGATLGPLGSSLFGPQPMGLSEAIAFTAAFPFAGALGGFVFWRTLGYPGLSKSKARSVERTRSGAEAMSDVAGGSIIGIGLAAHSMLKGEAVEDQEEERRTKRRRPPAAPVRKGFGKRAT